jgi:hypothetical protein
MFRSFLLRMLSSVQRVRQRLSKFALADRWCLYTIKALPRENTIIELNGDRATPARTRLRALV